MFRHFGLFYCFVFQQFCSLVHKNLISQVSRLFVFFFFFFKANRLLLKVLVHWVFYAYQLHPN